MLDKNVIIPLLKQAIKEDVNGGDVTTRSVVKKKRATGTILTREQCIVCGLPILQLACSMIDKKLKFKALVKEGAKVAKGTKLARVTGDIRSILTAERLLLNILSLCSGVATQTKQYVDKIKSYKTKILDTRKTLPSLRLLQKYAVHIGGGYNHRFGLFDMVMIKDNHIVATGITKAVDQARKKLPKTIMIEVETKTLKQVREAVTAGADRIMFDNMKPEMIKKALKLVDGECETESSGGINLKNITAYAKTGVDYVSIGALTHDLKSTNLTMEVR